MTRIMFALLLAVVFAPPINGQMFVDYLSPPATMRELMAKVPVVVRGRVEGFRYLNVGPEANRPVTEYGVRVLEVIKGTTVRVGDRLAIARNGGVIANKQMSEEGFSDFLPGEELLLFLEADARIGGYTPAYGPSGAYRVRGDVIESYASTPVAVKQHNRKLGEVLAELR